MCYFCGKYRKFKNPEISYIFEKTLVISIIFSECKNEDEKIFKEEKSIEILKIIDLIENIKFLWKYGWRTHKQRIGIKNIDETRNYLLEETEQNELMSRKHKKFCTTLNYIGTFLF